jgi:heme/copper-type cytochrome/quinol oxidase subunit 1
MMGAIDAVKKRPIASGVSFVAVVGALILFPKVMPSVELIVKIYKSPEIAEAAQEQAQENADWIKAWIAQAEAQREMDQKLAEQAQDYQRQMLEIQEKQYNRQQAPQQRAYPNQAIQQYRYEQWTEYNEDGLAYCIDTYGDWFWGEC